MQREDAEPAMTYPVSLRVEHPAHFTRLQLLVRFVAFCALGVLGLSFGTVFVFAYLALPVFAAVRLGSGEPAEYLDRDGARIVRGLHWLAAIGAWTGLVTDRLPTRTPPETVELAIGTSARPTPRSALWRVVTGLPSAFVLAFLGCIGSVVWIWAALSILFTQRVGIHAFRYLVGLQRWSVRLLAYEASLVDEYPPFSFAEEPAPSLPVARATP
jgi:hypothetical protein